MMELPLMYRVCIGRGGIGRDDCTDLKFLQNKYVW